MVALLVFPPSHLLPLPPAVVVENVRLNSLTLHMKWETLATGPPVSVSSGVSGPNPAALDVFGSARDAVQGCICADLSARMSASSWLPHPWSSLFADPPGFNVAWLRPQ